MKQDTRNGYIERVGKAIKDVVRLTEQCNDLPAGPDRDYKMERLQALFSDGMEVQDIVMKEENTVFVSNRLQAYEGKVVNFVRGNFEAEVREELDSPPTVDPADQSVEARVVRAIEAAQQSLFDAYELLLECTPLAKAVPEIQIIQAKGKDLTGVMQSFHRLGKISHGE